MNHIFKTFLVLVFLCATSGLGAANENESYELQSLLTQNQNGFSFQFNLKHFKNEKFEVNSETFSKLSVTGAGLLDKKGFPELPKIRHDLAFPIETTNVKILTNSAKYTRYSTPPALPSRGNLHRNEEVSKVPYEKSPIYSSKATYPKTWASLSELSILRDLKVATLEITPIRYDFESGEILVLESINIEVSYHGAAESMGWQQSLAELDTSFLHLYQQHFINFPTEELTSASESGATILDTGRLLILSHSSFKGELDEFVQWKRIRGFQVTDEYLDGAQLSWEYIRDLIRDRYRHDRISYVVLVGDAPLIPFHPGKSGNAKRNEADPMYALVAGNDSYPDLFISRISVNTIEELRTVLRKSIDYEKHPDHHGDWYSRALGLASEEGQWSGLKDYERINILRELLLGWHYTHVDQIYEPNDRREDVANALNDGRSFVNYIGHGSVQSWASGSFSNWDIAKLQNANMWPFIVSVACVNGQFAYPYGDSFAEAWIKAGTESAPTGAVAVFASSTNQSWVPPTVGQKRITELLTREVYNTIGSLFFNGSIAVLQDGDKTAKQTFETWHIFGDASLQVRTRRPEEIQIKQVRLVRAGEKNWMLHLATGSPFTSISISKENEIIARGSTNYAGAAYLTFKNDSLKKWDRVQVNLTGFNKIPRSHEISAQ